MTRESRIRVAVVSEPGKAGVKRHVVDLLRGLDLTRFDVALYYSLLRADAAYPGELAELRARGISCIEVAMEGTMKPRADLRSLHGLLEGLRVQRPHILHLHSSKAGAA